MRKTRLYLLAGMLAGLATFGSPANAGDCEGWNFNDPNCPEYIMGQAEGKAAYGMPGNELVPDEPRSCEDWSFNDNRCRAYQREGTLSTDRGFNSRPLTIFGVPEN